MSKKKSIEIDYRRQAFRFFEIEKSANQILQLIPRSRSWLYKWKRRFEQHGWSALQEFSQKPRSSPQAYPPKTRQLVLKLRRRMEKSAVGLQGAAVIRDYLLEHQLVKPVPSVSTIKRWLREAGFFQFREKPEREPYYPRMNFSASETVAATDWLSRYIRGGEKVFVFHTVDLQTHALCQSIATDKTAQTALAHLVKSLKQLGVIDFLQLDNDAAFTGLGRKPRIFGQFVRTALYFGIELVFIPPGEPKRNAVVERLGGLWASAFWNRNHFADVRQVRRKSGKFLTWYLSYHPPGLQGQSVRQASGQSKVRRLTDRDIEGLPEDLPLTAGRIHYYRRVDQAGQIEILKENFKISKTLRGQYVVATIDLAEEVLTVNYRRSLRSQAKQLKKFDYPISEEVVELKPKYRRRKERREEILQKIQRHKPEKGRA